MEQSELIEKVQKLGELIGTLSVVVYSQSCFIQILGQTSAKNSVVDSNGLVQASEIHRRNLKTAMKNMDIVGTELDELDETMNLFKEYQKNLAEEQKAFKERRAAVNRGEKPPQE